MGGPGSVSQEHKVVCSGQLIGSATRVAVALDGIARGGNRCEARGASGKGRKGGDDGMVTWPSEASADAHSVEEESYRILRSRIDLSRLPKYSRDVTERVIYTSADFDYATDLVCDEEALAADVPPLSAGAPVILDVAMVAAGITGCPVISKIGEPLTQRLARTA